MMLTQNLLNLLSGVFLVLASSGLVEGNECARGSTGGLQDVNLCEEGSHVITGAFLSASSVDMGDGTRCVCRMVALSPASNGSLFTLNQTPRVSNCSAFVTVRGSAQTQYTCLSNVANSQVTMNTSDVTIEVFRNDSVDFGFCLKMIEHDTHIGFKFNLTCESDGTTTSQPTGSSATTHTSSPASSWPNTPSSSTGESYVSSTSPLQTQTTKNSIVQTSTLLPTSDSTSASPVFPSGTTSSSSTTAASSVEVTLSEMTTTTSPGTSGEPPHDFPVTPVAAGVTGGLVFLIVVIIIVVVVCVRRKRQPKENPLPPRPEVKVCNRDFSDVHLEDNVLYESSSAWTDGEAPKTGGTTQPVEGGAGGGGTSGQTSGHLGRSQYLGPAGDVYSLVQKAGEDGGPGHLQSAQLRSTPDLSSTEVLQGDADDQSDEDDPRLQCNGGEEGNHSVGEDMTSTSLRPSSLTPGLRCVDVELARDQDGRTEKVSSKDDNATTEYTIIGHEATKNKTTEL